MSNTSKPGIYGKLACMFAQLILCGCVTTKPDVNAPAAPVIADVVPDASERETPLKIAAPPSDAERLLAYYERLKKMPAAELAREHESARQAYARGTVTSSRISYAMLLSLPGTSFTDEARALDLLDPVVKRSEESLRSLAFLLTAFIQERRRAGSELSAMQQKLDALKSMERNLIEREQKKVERK